MKIQDQRQPQTDLIFVRHAQSQNNAAIYEYITQRKIQYTWQNVSKCDKFLNEIKYNPKLIDCSITQQGRRQCKEAKIYTDYLKPDVILVSPLHRALETCNFLFGKRKIPVFVQPILSEGLRSACDVSSSTKQKKDKYPLWNFSQILLNDDLWYLHHQTPQMQQIIEQKLESMNLQNQSNEQNGQKILRAMKQTRIFELSTSLRSRAKKIKQLLKKYNQKYKKIAIVAHYNSINYTISKKFNQKDEPIDSPHLNNCQVYLGSLEQILKYQ